MEVASHWRTRQRPHLPRPAAGAPALFVDQPGIGLWICNPARISLLPTQPSRPRRRNYARWEPVTTPLAIDSSAFALSAQGKVRGDGDFIFYNQLALAGGGLQRASDGRSFTIVFAQLPAAY
jgi:hypothetical protein